MFANDMKKKRTIGRGCGKISSTLGPVFKAGSLTKRGAALTSGMSELSVVKKRTNEARASEFSSMICWGIDSIESTKEPSKKPFSRLLLEALVARKPTE
jgi:hypothetical protein